MRKTINALFLCLFSYFLSGCNAVNIDTPKITLDKQSVTLSLDDFEIINPTVNVGYALGFESLDNTVFTVNDRGVITPVSPGKTKLKVFVLSANVFVFVDVTVLSDLIDDSGDKDDDKLENEQVIQKEVVSVDIVVDDTVLSEGIIEVEETLELGVVLNCLITQGEFTTTETEKSYDEIIWVSSNNQVASIDKETGVVTAEAAGTATISVLVNGKFASLFLTVLNNDKIVIPSESVYRIDAPMFMVLGANANIKVFRGEEEIDAISFRSENEEIIEVSSTGLISAKKPGVASINVFLEDETPLGSHMLLVKEGQEVGVFQLDEVYITGPREVLVNSQILLKTEFSPSDANATFTYSSSNEAIATVENSGWVTGISGGSATITTTCAGNSDYKAIYKITVIPIVNSIIITGSKSVSYGQNIMLSAVASPTGANNSVSWSSSDSSIATVDDNGRVTGLSAGSVEITAKSILVSEVSATVNVVVTDEMSITINPTNILLNVGASKTISAYVTAASLSDKSIIWSSSNSSIATVSSSGVVNAKAVGEIIVIAKLKADNSVQAQIIVTVTAALKPAIKISIASVALLVGATKTLTATVSNTTNTAVTWTSSNASVATVVNGVVTAKAAGAATITATSAADTSVKATSAITVTAPPAGALTVTQSPTGSIKVGAEEYTLYIADSSGTAVSRLECTFVSANASIATVSAYGTVSALKTGSVKITVTHPSKGSGTITLTVVAATVTPPVTPVKITSVSPRYFTTEASFKASPAYKKYTDYASKVVYGSSFAIPGMAKTNHAGKTVTTMTPQGLTAAGSYFLVSAYDSSGTNKSVIYVINSSGKFLTTIILPSSAHIGGLAYDGYNVWVTGSGSTISCFKYSVLTTAVNSGKEYYVLSKYLKNFTITGTPSFMSYYNGMVWVGKFNANANDYMYSYTVGSASQTPTLTRKYKIEVPDRTQGVAFTSTGYLVISRSYGRNPTYSSYISQLRCYKPSWSSPRATDNLVYKNSAVKTLTLPPMAEGAVVKGSYLYVAFESCATNYNNCPYITDRIIAFKTSSFF